MATTLQATADVREDDCVRPFRDVAETVARDLGFSDKQVSAVKLCVSEAVTNVVRHAYPETEHGDVVMSVREVGDELEIVVTDHGHGTGPGREHSENSGFGLAVVSRMASRCTFTATSEGTAVEMFFLLPRRTARAGAGSLGEDEQRVREGFAQRATAPPPQNDEQNATPAKDGNAAGSRPHGWRPREAVPHLLPRRHRRVPNDAR